VRVLGFAEEALRPTDMPGADMKIRTVRLRGASGGWAWSAVRFPPGFSRPGSGWYPADEEVLFLEGRLEMSGEIFRAGDYAFFPAGYLRSATSAPDGALALAWFSDPPTWTPAPHPGPMFDVHRSLHLLPAQAPRKHGPFGVGRVLRQQTSQTWWMSSLAPNHSPCDATVASGVGRVLVEIASGETIPQLTAPLLVKC
jgi:hypothetical protein